MSLKTLCHQLRCLDTRECSENVLLMSLKNNIIRVGYTKDRRTMFRKCSLYVAKNIILSVYARQQTQEQCSENVLFKSLKTISSALATQKTEGQCSENVPFMSLKTSYYQCMLHSRHKDNVQKNKRNENL